MSISSPIRTPENFRDSSREELTGDHKRKAGCSSVFSAQKLILLPHVLPQCSHIVLCSNVRRYWLSKPSLSWDMMCLFRTSTLFGEELQQQTATHLAAHNSFSALSQSAAIYCIATFSRCKHTLVTGGMITAFIWSPCSKAMPIICRLKDPLVYMARYPDADILTSSDHLVSQLA